MLFVIVSNHHPDPEALFHKHYSLQNCPFVCLNSCTLRWWLIFTGLTCMLRQSILFFIIFIIKYMKNKHAKHNLPYTQQQSTQEYDELTLRNKFSFNLPDCSLVLQTTPQLDTNELSWLDRIPSDQHQPYNQNILEDPYFDQSQNDHNQMKFSFNMNYNYQFNDHHNYEQPYNYSSKTSKELLQPLQPPPQSKQKYQTNNKAFNTQQISRNGYQNINILGQLQLQTENSTNTNRSIKLPGSIKKNRKFCNDSEDYSSQIREIADHITDNKLQEMNKRLNAALSREKYSSKKNSHDDHVLKERNVENNKNVDLKSKQKDKMRQQIVFSRNVIAVKDKDDREDKQNGMLLMRQKKSNSLYTSNHKPEDACYDKIKRQHQSKPKQPFQSTIKRIPSQLFQQTKQATTNTKPAQNTKATNNIKLSSPLIKYHQHISSSSAHHIDDALEHLFQSLDQAKIGKLVKANCHVQNIQEEFKFIFGEIFTKVKLKNIEYNKRQFIKTSKNIIIQLQSPQIITLLHKLNPNYLSSASKAPTSYAQQSQMFLSNIKNTAGTGDEWSSGCYRKQSSVKVIQADCYSLKETLKFNNIKDEKEVEQHGQKNRGSTDRKRSCFNIGKQDTRDTVHRKRQQSKTSFAKTHQKQNQFHSNQPLKQTTTTTNKPQSQTKSQSQSKRILFSQQYRGGGINRQTLKQHKKSLQQIDHLNRKIQLCLRGQMASQSNSSSNNAALNQSSLFFSELIKHI